MSNYILIPQEDIDKLEEARLHIFELFKHDPKHIGNLTYGVTDIMYRITHTKYYKGRRLK